MELGDKLSNETILVPMLAISKEAAIQELLTHLLSLDILSDTIKLFTYIKEQESIFTSSAGRGIAYPHSTSIEIDKLTCILGISHKGIDFNSPDGHDCHIILLTLSPINEPKEHRKFITRFRSMVDNPEVRSHMIDSRTCNETFNIISDWENENNQDDII